MLRSYHRYIILILAICLWTIPQYAMAQSTKDSSATFQEIPNPKKEKFQPKPKKSGLYSAILPGMGQLYNRQYWKVPVIYAGMAVAVYFLAFNIDQYNTYRKAYIGRISNDPTIHDAFEGIYDTQSLKQLQDGYKRYVDISVLVTALGYVIQVMDAVTFAHLKNFDVSKDISMQVQPIALPGGLGVGLVLNFK
ncbi:MAG: DUF5683 domain-containing protein [Bacteroidota bacterium]